MGWDHFAVSTLLISILVFLVRHSGVSRNPSCPSFRSSFRRKPESSSCAVLLVCLQVQELPRSSAARVTFFACAKKVTKETHPRWRGLRASLPSDFASVLRRFADGTSLCPQRTGAHPARHPAGFFLRTLAAPQGAPFGRLPAAEATATARARFAERQTISAKQCRDARVRGSRAPFAAPRSAGQFDSHDANRTTAVGASLFGYFLGNAKK